ncbi:Por secretion system C-terminal sorting domain-containing protein [Catalinimonas alkaloidigena]|uniref:Por secretion system C-terminal sorting domain-containing protein n=2 Tax=Catalinimonas alkaloidigena TaxID=1075417 RepID=A0A1G9LUR7_9BACT|nr:Por secretion system C-terminal sorting domain-containing protein [Catalinimonas alkaloidigena]
MTYHKPVQVQTALSGRVEAYPNPFRGVLTLSVRELADAPQRVTVYSLQGQQMEVYEAAHTDRQWDLSLPHLPAGIYLLEVTTLTERQHLRVVKQ